MLQPFYTFLSSLADLGAGGYNQFVRKPLFLLGKQGLKVRDMFVGLPQRQVVTIYAGILWVLVGTMVQPYVTLYMVRLGLSETEVGVYQALMNGVGIAGYFLGGYLSDAWGRKKSLILFDSLGWGGFCLCMALADSKWWCVAALFFMSLVSGSVTPYFCLLAEGIGNKKRVVVFTLVQVVNYAPTLFFFPLLGGLWVGQRGLVAASHEMFWLYLALVITGILFRAKYLPKSPTFEKPPENWLHVFREAVQQYREALKKFFKKPASAAFLSSKLLDEWMIAVWGTYSSIYFVDHLGLKTSYLSVIQQGAGYAAVFLLFLIIPNLTVKQMAGVLGADQVLGFAALAVLLIPFKESPNVLPLGLLSASLWAMAANIYGSVTFGVWMNYMEEKERAKVVAASYSIVKIGNMTGTLGALLFGKVSPLSLILVMMVLRILNFFLLRGISRKLKNA